jgi:integrase/recombinase XerD
MPTLQGKGQAAILSNEQIDSIIDLASPRYRPIFAIAAFTGCRISEARLMTADRLDLGDLGNETILFTQTKTKVDRMVALHPELVEILKASNLPSSGLLFPSPKSSGAVSRVCVDGELRRICDDLGLIGVSTHSFRRSLATNLHEKGVDLKSIGSVTGHKSLDQLAKYIDVSPEKQRSAIMALR